MIKLGLMKSCCCLSAIVLTMMLAACSSPKQENEPLKFEERINRQQKSMTSMYDKDFNTSSAGDRGGMKWFQKKGFHTDEFSGQKSYAGVKDYKTKGFSQAGKTSRYGSQDSHLGKMDNRMGSSSYATKDSRYSSMSASQGDQSFQGSDRTFKTGEFQPAKKSINDNKRIFIDSSGEPEKSADAYSESQVRRLLGR